MKTIVAVYFLIAIQMNLTIIQSKRIPMFSHHHSKTVSVIMRYRMPKSCLWDYTPYCFEKGDNYPDKVIANLLKNMTDLHISTQDNVIDHRDGNEGEEPDCPSIATNKPIYYIIDKFDKVRVVVQMPDKFEQIYTVRWCENEGEIRNETQHFLFNTTLSKHRMECVNMKLNYDFFVLGYDGMSLERVQAKGGIPVCCRCRQMDYKTEKNK